MSKKKQSHTGPAPSPNSDGKNAPTPTGTTIFELTQDWSAAAEAWRSHIIDGNQPAAPLRLHLEQQPTTEDPSQGTIYAVTPTPTGSARDDIIRHEGFAAFAARCHRLVEVTKSASAVLRRFDESTEAAEVLVRVLQVAEPVPTREGWDATYLVQQQLQRIETLVWDGALPEDEDRAERAACWSHERTTLVTPEALDEFDKLVALIMKKPRDLAQENEVRNLASRLRQKEIRTVPLAEIIGKPTPDAHSKCAQWNALADFGIRFFSRRSTNQPGVETIDFGNSVVANQLFPTSAYDGPELRWARALVAATQSMRPLAATVGIGADTLLAFVRLELDFERILKGDATDIGKHLEEVRVLVKAIEASTAKAASPKAEEWVPNAHQELVLNILRRDGRLRAGVLWARISPKHIEERAHQSAMKDLIANKKVEKAGKGQATEYWIL